MPQHTKSNHSERFSLWCYLQLTVIRRVQTSNLSAAFLQSVSVVYCWHLSAALVFVFHTVTAPYCKSDLNTAPGFSPPTVCSALNRHLCILSQGSDQWTSLLLLAPSVCIFLLDLFSLSETDLYSCQGFYYNHWGGSESQPQFLKCLLRCHP